MSKFSDLSKILPQNPPLHRKRNMLEKSSNFHKNQSIPKSVNPEKDGRVNTGVADDLGLAHLHGPGHPIQEGQVRGEPEVDEPAHEVPGPGAGPRSGDVPFREVHPIVDGLDPEQSKRQKEREGAYNVDERRHANVLQSSHGSSCNCRYQRA